MMVNGSTSLTGHPTKKMAPLEVCTSNRQGGPVQAAQATEAGPEEQEA